jgi:cysteine synthase A
MPIRLPEQNRYTNRPRATPLTAVQLSPEQPAIWCKLDFLNPSGSTKDRIARYILEKAWRQGQIGPNSTVVEASSGSTSIAMALASSQLGVKFIAVLPEGVSNERSLIIKAYGGEVQFSPKADGIVGAINAAKELGRRPDVFLPDQFNNPDNAEAHRVGTAREIIDQIPSGNIDAVVSGVGTGGTLVGLFEGFRESGCKVIPCHARPVNITHNHEIECCSFSSRIPGVADRISTIFQEERLPGLMTLEVDDSEALDTTRKLIRLGFPVGPSSGLNYTASLMVAKQLGDPSAQIVTVFADRMERYFTTELFRPWRTDTK